MKWLCTPLLFLLFLPTAPAYALMSSVNYTISSTVISGGGGTMSSAGYALASTIGQPIPSETTSSTSFILETGFWHTFFLAIIGDVNGDGDVDLEDVITALHITTGQSPALIIKEADADGDGKIGLSETLHILRKLSE
jgi:hypothetical protein